MSCSCHQNPCRCRRCDPEREPLSSALDNFTSAFFGSVSKSCVNNQVVWNLPCNLEDGIPDFPRLPGEGLACYFLRYMETNVPSPQQDCTVIPHDTIVVGNRCYTTWQSAYEAAIMLPGDSIAMYVGVTTDQPSPLGDLILVADYDSRVKIIGTGKNNSLLGNLIATNSENGYNVNMTVYNIAFGNIDTSTSDITGTFNGGDVSITAEGICFMLRVVTSALNGNLGGDVSFFNHEYRMTDVDTRGQNGGGNFQVAYNVNISYGTYGSQVSDIDTRAMVSGSSGDVKIGDGTYVDSINTSAPSGGTGGDITIRRGAIIAGNVLRGTNSPGAMQLDGPYIYGQIDNIGSNSRFKDVIFMTNSGNRSNIQEVLSDGALFTGCFFVTHGTGVPIASSTPKTIISHFTVSQKALDADVTVSSGTFTVEPGLNFTQ